MRELKATVLSHEFAWSSFRTLRLHAPALGRVAPGQFVLLRSRSGLDQLLPRPVLVSRQDVRTGAIESITEDLMDSRHAWMRLRTDDPMWMLGPAGRSFNVDGQTRRAVLVGGGLDVGPLLHLAIELLEQGREVTFIGLRDSTGAAMPGTVLPPEVEYVVASEKDLSNPLPALISTLESLLAWADQLFLALPEGYLTEVLNLLRRRLMRLRKGFAQALVSPTVLPCGLGACDLCVIPTHHGLRRLCRDGLVFDLLSLI